MTLGDSLRRGLAAGLTAGLLSGLFALLVGEIPVREAIRLEEQAAAAASADDPVVEEPPLVDRTTQQAMLPVATGIVGSAFGGLFGLTWTGVRRRLRERSEWRASLKLGAVAWAGVALFPGIVYPANPPAVGDPGTIGSRSSWFLVAVVVGLAVAALAWVLAVRLRERGVEEAPRQVLVAAALVVAAGTAFALLPANTDPIEIPAALLWEFRLASIATQLLLWAGIAVGFGWSAHRAQSRNRPAVSDVA
jgi:predicted cobalt transporter CbtA